MSYQITKVDLIPNGEIVKCNASQFDNGRVLPFEIYENGEAYNIPNDIRLELHCRKPDGNVVTLPSDTINDNIVTFITTTQLTACYGDNVCEIALYGDDDYLIGSANFILEVEKSPTYGGIDSTTAIHNLESQIRDIAEDVIPEIIPEYLDNYYTKSEVDALIDNIFPTFTASGAIASFITALTKPLVNVVAAENATMITRCGVNLCFDAYGDKAISGTYLYPSGDNLPIIVNNNLRTAYAYVGKNADVVISFADVPQRSVAYGLESYPALGVICHALRVTALSTKTFKVNSGAYDYIAFYYCNDSGNIPSDCQIELGNTASEYHAYNGQTVPISEATTLVTESGVNNVFADVGAVTVGYKYMSMPETPTNTNRLALSSVRSDIIKEKSEIEEQSDIIEDIERGEKNE